MNEWVNPFTNLPHQSCVMPFSFVARFFESKRRPVTEVVGSLIDTNAYNYSNRYIESREEEGDCFVQNPNLWNQNERIKKMSNNEKNQNTNDQVPLVQAQVVPETSNYYATPNTYFQYDSETMNRDNATNNIPVAPAFVSIDDESPSEQEHAVSRKTRFGSDMGRILALEEKEKTQRASANAKAMPYFEGKRIEAGDKIAKQRNREGLDVKEDKYFDETNLIAARKAREAAETASDTNQTTKTSDSGSGYQVSDYNVGEYDCAKYETKEYKSIYD